MGGKKMVSAKYQKYIKSYPFFTEEELHQRAERRRLHPDIVGRVASSMNMRGDLDFGGVDLTVRVAYIMKAPFTIEEQGFVHNFHQYLGFASSDPNDPENLGGEADFYFGQEGYKYSIHKNAVIHVPPGVIHCPLDFKRIDRPMLWLEIFTSSKYLRTAVYNIRQGASKESVSATEYAKHIKTAPFFTSDELKEMKKINPDMDERGPLLSVQGINDFGGVDMNVALRYIKKPQLISSKPHAHNFHQYHCFLNSDYNNLSNLGGEAEICFGEEKEKYVINKPTIVHIAPGLVHCPLNFTKVDKDKPMLWLEIFTSPFYAVTAEY
jgi:hypothetical protein